MLNPKTTFQAMAVRVLRQHRYCGDAYPEDGWPEVNAALAQYALERRIIRKHASMMRRLRRMQRPRRLTSVPVDGCADQVAPNSEVERGAAATEHHR